MHYRIIFVGFDVNNLMFNAKKNTLCIEFALPNVKKKKNSLVIKGKNLNCTESTVFLDLTTEFKFQWKKIIYQKIF